jgi:hypothetical protein
LTLVPRKTTKYANDRVVITEAIISSRRNLLPASLCSIPRAKARPIAKIG